MEKKQKSVRDRQASTRNHAPAERESTPSPQQQLLLAQRTAGNQAAIQMFKQHRAMPVIQRHYKLDDQEYKRESYSQDEISEGGTNGSFTQVQADRGLPTFYGVLSKVFSPGNVNKGAFSSTKLGHACDRPHSVSADLVIKNTNMREGDQNITSIGHLGTDELNIREGPSTSRNIVYNGGHLVGHQVLGGAGANKGWNVAPQDESNNMHAYNNTIERMARNAAKDTEISYNVNLSYKSLNFNVEQKQLLERGYIHNYESDKPWRLQMPTRIPQHWEAEARIKNPGGKSSFGMPTNGEKAKTNLQSSQELQSPLSHTDGSHTARFKLSVFNQGDELPRNQLSKKNINSIDSVTYRMHQEQPVDIGQSAPPDDWTGPKTAEFGTVEEEQVTAEKVKTLIEDIKKELESIEKMEDEPVDSFDFTTFFTEIAQSYVQEPLSTPNHGKSQQEEQPDDRMINLVVLVNQRNKEMELLNSELDRFKRASLDLEKSNRLMEESRFVLKQAEQDTDVDLLLNYSKLKEIGRRKDDHLVAKRTKNNIAKKVNELKRTYEKAFPREQTGETNGHENKRKRMDNKRKQKDNQLKKPASLVHRRSLTFLFGRGTPLNNDLILEKIQTLTSGFPYNRNETNDKNTD